MKWLNVGFRSFKVAHNKKIKTVFAAKQKNYFYLKLCSVNQTNYFCINQKK